MEVTEIENVSISIPEDSSSQLLAEFIYSKLETSIPSSTTTQCSIYRVQKKFRKISESAYTPEIISIGPFHRGKDSLTEMEDHKLRYAKQLLSRMAPFGINLLKECIEQMKRIEDEARKCYSEHIELSSDSFVEMMVIDGLFMIELFMKNADEVKIERDDPVFSRIAMLPSLVRDLILLENQLPMVVLECLFEVAIEKSYGVSLNILALRFFDQLMPRGKKIIRSNFEDHEGKHLLDLFGKTFHDLRHKEDKANYRWKAVPSVTELRSVGVKFVKSSSVGSFLDIKFKDGVMVIPPIIIQDQTDTLLRNLIAFEQYSDGLLTYMTSYAFFMDSLIDSGEDVGVLSKQGIIKNYLGDDEVIATLFNKLCCEVTLANFYYSDLCDKVNKYYKTRRHGLRATLTRFYFKSPWAVISCVGAILLLSLTLVSSLFAVRSFYKS